LVRVKICGLLEVEHAVVAAKAGADFIGMVFKESRRRITPERAKEITSAIKEINPRPEAVGIFADEPLEKVLKIARECALDRVQLAGDETVEYCHRITVPIFKVLHINASANARGIFQKVEQWHTAMAGRNFRVLMDTEAGGMRGGTGQTFDWGIAREVAEHYPVIIAGGLNPENVGNLMKQVRPWGVDVSSGIETDGRKDPVKIEAFVRAAWNAE